jgi:SAM-dependent methyltransferase
MKDVSLLRAHAASRLSALPVQGLRVAELGGRKGGEHARLFTSKACTYIAVGFEGDLNADLRTTPLPLPDASQDLLLVSMVLMYFDDPAAVSRLMADCRRILVPGGQLVLVEPFLYADTPHGEIADRARWTAHGLEALLTAQRFDLVRVEKLGGVAGVLLSLCRDLLPAFLSPLRAACTSLGLALDAGLNRVAYFRRRNARYYVGHFTTATRP